MQKPFHFTRLTIKTCIVLLMLSGIIIMLDSCGRCDGCWESGGIAFYNFSQTELDSVVIKEYVRGSNFTTLKDSVIRNAVQAGDSLTYIINLSIPGNSDSAQSDVLIYLPADNRTYRITNISTVPSHCTRCPNMQLYTYSSYNVNGVAGNVPYNPQNLNGGYIRVSK